MKKIIAIIMALMFLLSTGAFCAADDSLLWEKLGITGEAYDVAVDSKNNVIVVGNSGIMKYNSNGNLIWNILTNNLQSVAVDSKDRIIVTGPVVSASTKIYDPNGNLLKEISFPGYEISVDSNDNIVVIGGLSTTKYDSSGNLILTISWGGNAGTVDSKGNILISDYGSGNFNTRKYDPNGNFLWLKVFDSGYNDTIYGVATDSFDNVIVAGYYYPPSITGTVIIKYSPDGTKILEMTDNTEYRAFYDVATDSYNNIVAIGIRRDASNNYQWLTVKYDPNGKKTWEKTFDYPGDSYNQSRGLAIDSKDSIIVTGFVESPYKYYTIKYGEIKMRLAPMNWIIKKFNLANKDKE